MTRDAFAVEMGQRITKARRAAGLSQQNLAARLSVTRQTLTNIEAGKVGITVIRAMEIAEACKVTVSYLIGESLVDLTHRLLGTEAALACLAKMFDGPEARSAWAQARAALSHLPSMKGQ